MGRESWCTVQMQHQRPAGCDGPADIVTLLSHLHLHLFNYHSKKIWNMNSQTMWSSKHPVTFTFSGLPDQYTNLTRRLLWVCLQGPASHHLRARGNPDSRDRRSDVPGRQHFASDEVLRNPTLNPQSGSRSVRFEKMNEPAKPRAPKIRKETDTFIIRNHDHLRRYWIKINAVGGRKQDATNPTGSRRRKGLQFLRCAASTLRHDDAGHLSPCRSMHM